MSNPSSIRQSHRKASSVERSSMAPSTSSPFTMAAKRRNATSSPMDEPHISQDRCQSLRAPPTGIIGALAGELYSFDSPHAPYDVLAARFHHQAAQGDQRLSLPPPVSHLAYGFRIQQDHLPVTGSTGQEGYPGYDNPFLDAAQPFAMNAVASHREDGNRYDANNNGFNLSQQYIEGPGQYSHRSHNGFPPSQYLVGGNEITQGEDEGQPVGDYGGNGAVSFRRPSQVSKDQSE
jgi:hypothetical protein